MPKAPILAILFCLLSVPLPLDAQIPQATFPRATPRKQFVTLTVDGMNTLPLHFKEFPLEELVGKELSAVQFEEHADYRSRDGLTTVDVLEYRRRTQGAGINVYPFGMSVGATLMVRASIEQIPVTRVMIHEPNGSERYELLDGRAVDFGVGLMVSDRSAGWGIGSQAFILAGIGQVRGDRGDGSRRFAEGGGGITVGPFGLQLAVKFARNTLEDPRRHRFLTVPVTLRGTVSF
jgi:hypothetical protein